MARLRNRLCQIEPLFDTLIKSSNAIGIKYNADYNGANQEGIAMTQATILRVGDKVRHTVT